MEHDASIQLLTLKKKFHSSNICFQFDPRREAVSFRKSSCYCFLQMWNVSRVAEAGSGKQLQFRWYDNMRKSSKALNQDSSCRKGNEKRKKSPVSVPSWALWALSGIRSTGLKAARIFELPELLSKSLHELAPWKAADPEFFKVAWLLRCQCEWFPVLTLQVKPSHTVLYGGNTQENWLKSMVCKTRSTTPTLKSQEIHFSCKLVFPKRGSRSWREYRLGKSLLECALNSVYKDTEDMISWLNAFIKGSLYLKYLRNLVLQGPLEDKTLDRLQSIWGAQLRNLRYLMKEQSL